MRTCVCVCACVCVCEKVPGRHMDGTLKVSRVAEREKEGVCVCGGGGGGRGVVVDIG